MPRSSVPGRFWVPIPFVLQRQFAAMSVLSMYRKITTLNLSAFPPLALAREDATRTNTRTGAIPLSAPTNISPNMEIHSCDGTRNPRIAPMIRPIKILRTRLILVHFCQMFINNLFSKKRKIDDLPVIVCSKHINFSGFRPVFYLYNVFIHKVFTAGENA